MSLKTHEPSAARLRQAERRGDLPVSALATRSVGFALGALLLPVALGVLGLRCLDTLQRTLAATTASTQPEQAAALLRGLASDIALVLVPWLGAIALGTMLITLLQTRGHFSGSSLAPKWDRLRPDRAWANIASGSHWSSLALALTASALVAGTAAYLIVHHLDSLAHSAERPLASAPLAAWLVEHLIWVSGSLALAAGLADWLLRRANWQQRQRMSHAEWLEDQKNSYGDPLLRAERQRLHREQLGD
jgi:flagellar biosynthesis protein FlhB